jgi:aspartyl-tRNA(Asn)/glutamyl-tRNA(Gln) amidotransferase subunit B
MPEQKRARLTEQYGLKEDEAILVSAEKETADYFEALVRLGAPSRLAAQWTATRLLPALKERDLSLTQSG